MKQLQLPNPKSTKHRALYERVNEISEILESGRNNIPFLDAVMSGASPSNKATKEVLEYAWTPKNKCEFLDHQPAWCGDSYACATCGLVFIPKVKENPHWESDYAAIWNEYDNSAAYYAEDLKRDILELIRGIV